MTFGPKGGIKAAVYDSPRKGLPALSVIFGTDGEVLVARTMPSSDAAEAFNVDKMAQFSSERGMTVKAT